MRILKAATSECLADEAGVPGPEYRAYYARVLRTPWLDGAVTGHIIVCPQARPEAGNVYLREGRLGWVEDWPLGAAGVGTAGGGGAGDAGGSGDAGSAGDSMTANETPASASTPASTASAASAVAAIAAAAAATAAAAGAAGPGRGSSRAPAPSASRDDRFQAYLRANAELLHELGLLARDCPPGKLLLPQLNHGGRQIPRSFLKKTGAAGVVSPARRAVPKALGIFPVPTDRLEGREAQNRVISQFAFACRALTEVCGFPGVQLHLAHGYLLNDMLDCRRYAFLAALLGACRGALGRALLAVKVCLSREVCEALRDAARPGGAPPPSGAWGFCQALEANADLIEISAGSYSHPTFAQAWKNADSVFGLPYARLWAGAFAAPRRARVMVTGRVRSRAQAAAVLEANPGVVDCVGMARLFCLPDPDAPGAAELVKKGVPVSLPVKYSLKAASCFLPLANAGPNTAFWRECLRNVAAGRIRENAQAPCVAQPDVVRWCVRVLRGALFGDCMPLLEGAELDKCMRRRAGRRGAEEQGEGSPALSGLSSPGQGNSQYM